MIVWCATSPIHTSKQSICSTTRYTLSLFARTTAKSCKPLSTTRTSGGWGLIAQFDTSTSICPISNSDIYFDETLELLQHCDLTRTILGLSRYDNGYLFAQAGSQDCWIGVAPLNVNTNICGFKFGVLGCDNRFAQIIHDAGYHIYNPSKTIHTHHQHGSQYRTYHGIPTVEGMHKLLEPCELYPSS